MRSSYNGRVLFVDLSKDKTWVYTLDDYYLSAYLGGRGAAALMLWEMTGPGPRALSRNNVLRPTPRNSEQQNLRWR